MTASKRALIWLAIMAVLVALLSGCESIRYVPVETVRTHKVTKHDSIYLETIKHDSVTIREKGDTVFVDRWHTEYKDRWRDRRRDSLRVDSVQVPYPVERELSRWEHFCLDYGKVTTGGTAVLIVAAVIWLVRRGRRK